MYAYHIDAGDLIDFAQRWSRLGDAVTSQVATVVDDPVNADDINPAAIQLAERELRGLNEGIDEAFDTYREHHMRPR